MDDDRTDAEVLGRQLDAALLRVEELKRETTESRQLQRATSEVLRLISAHPGDLNVVLNGVLGLAMSLSDADGATFSAVRGSRSEIIAAVGHRADAALGFEAAFDFADVRARFDDVESVLGEHPIWGPYCRRLEIRSQLSVSS